MHSDCQQVGCTAAGQWCKKGTFPAQLSPLCQKIDGKHAWGWSARTLPACFANFSWLAMLWIQNNSFTGKFLPLRFCLHFSICRFSYLQRHYKKRKGNMGRALFWILCLTCNVDYKLKSWPAAWNGVQWWMIGGSLLIYYEELGYRHPASSMESLDQSCISALEFKSTYRQVYCYRTKRKSFRWTISDFTRCEVHQE